MQSLGSFGQHEALGDVVRPIVVGVDFGTVDSGIAIGIRANGHHIQCPPLSPLDDLNSKTPTELVHHYGRWQIGRAARDLFIESAMSESNSDDVLRLFRQFKSKVGNIDGDFDMAYVTSTNGAQRGLMELVVAVLMRFKEHALGYASQYFGRTVRSTEVQWVLAVSSTWNDVAKAFMRRAAFRAGLMDDELSESLQIVLETDAVLASVLSQEFFRRPGQNRIMVVDCGAGIVDITVHDINSCGELQVTTVDVPRGGSWGGLVEDRFKTFLRELLGDHIYMQNANTADFFMILQEFHRMLHGMRERSGDSGSLRLIDVLEDRRQLRALVDAYNANHPAIPVPTPASIRAGILTLSRQLLESFFEPLLTRLLTAMRQALDAVPNVTKILLTGGYGRHPCVLERVRNEFHRRGQTDVLVLDAFRQGTEVMVGAAQLGLHPGLVTRRMCPYTYGIATHTGAMHVLVRKGDMLPTDHIEEFPPTAMVALTTNAAPLAWQLYASNDREMASAEGALLVGTVYPITNRHIAPQGMESRIPTLRFKFGGPEIKVYQRNVDGVERRLAIVPP